MATPGQDLAPHVSAAAEPLAGPWETPLGPFTVTNSMFTMWLTMAGILALAWFATRHIRRDPDAALVPGGLQN
ncbi:MAG: hypothetical protein OXI70_13075, partial [Chloroflexota bacterium]|nr:hypothetical protein [Chloroflexota bacterium]